MYQGSSQLPASHRRRLDGATTFPAKAQMPSEPTTDLLSCLLTQQPWGRVSITETPRHFSRWQPLRQALAWGHGGEKVVMRKTSADSPMTTRAKQGGPQDIITLQSLSCTASSMRHCNVPGPQGTATTFGTACPLFPAGQEYSCSGQNRDHQHHSAMSSATIFPAFLFPPGYPPAGNYIKSFK